MQVVCFLPIDDPKLNQEHRPAHLRYLQGLFEQGKITMAGPFADGSGGMVIYHVADEREAEGYAKADPAVTSGARHYRLQVFKPLEFPLNL